MPRKRFSGRPFSSGSRRFLCGFDCTASHLSSLNLSQLQQSLDICLKFQPRERVIGSLHAVRLWQLGTFQVPEVSMTVARGQARLAYLRGRLSKCGSSQCCEHHLA